MILLEGAHKVSVFCFFPGPSLPRSVSVCVCFCVCVGVSVSACFRVRGSGGFSSTEITETGTGQATQQTQKGTPRQRQVEYQPGWCCLQHNRTEAPRAVTVAWRQKTRADIMRCAGLSILIVPRVCCGWKSPAGLTTCTEWECSIRSGLSGRGSRNRSGQFPRFQRP